MSRMVLIQSASSMSLSAALSNALGATSSNHHTVTNQRAPMTVMNSERGLLTGNSRSSSQHCSPPTEEAVLDTDALQGAPSSATVPVSHHSSSVMSDGHQGKQHDDENPFTQRQQLSSTVVTATPATNHSHRALASTSSRRHPTTPLPPPPSSVCALTKSFLAKVRAQQDSKITQKLNIGRCVLATTGEGGTHSNVTGTSKAAALSRSQSTTTKKAVPSSAVEAGPAPMTTTTSYLSDVSHLLDGSSNAAVTIPRFGEPFDGEGRADNDSGDDDETTSISSGGTDVSVVEEVEYGGAGMGIPALSGGGTSALYRHRRASTTSASAEVGNHHLPAPSASPTTPTGNHSAATDLLRRISSFSQLSSSVTTTASRATISSMKKPDTAAATTHRKGAASSATAIATGLKRTRSTSDTPFASSTSGGAPGKKLAEASTDSEDIDEGELTEAEKEHARGVIRRQEMRRLQTFYSSGNAASSGIEVASGGGGGVSTSLLSPGSPLTPLERSATTATTTAMTATTVSSVLISKESLATKSTSHAAADRGFTMHDPRSILARRRSAFVSEIIKKDGIAAGASGGGDGDGADSNSNSVSIARMLKRTNSVENSRVAHKTLVFGAAGNDGS